MPPHCGFSARAKAVTRGMRDERGLTLADILVGAAIMSIGVAGLMQVIPVSSFAIQEGNQLTTATFLAGQRLEEVRNAPWTALPANDCVGVGQAAPTVPVGSSCANGAVAIAAGGMTFADEANVPGYTAYSRTVRITDCAGGCSGINDPNARRVTVSVSYRPLTANGVSAATKAISFDMLKAQR